MLRLSADKIGSVTKNVNLGREIRVATEITPESGYIVAGRIHGEKSTYNTVETCTGRLVSLQAGDILVGALGHRNALHGYAGIVPKEIQVGDMLHVLNLGGVIGQCTSANLSIGQPFGFEVLGAVQVFPEFGSRIGIPAHTGMGALEAKGPLSQAPRIPIVFLVGTCMEAGKTTAASRIIKELSRRDKKVAGAKLTGVSLLRDTLSMKDHGASWASSFMDTGVVTTSPQTAVSSASQVLSSLSSSGAEVVVAELGDGMMGLYGVREILADKEIMSRCACLILSANDPVGAWGGAQMLQQKYGLNVDLITGPTTDNSAGVASVQEALGVPGINARLHGAELAQHVHNIVFGD